jgi:hypothetical protein
MTTQVRELVPTNNRKSFYGKCQVIDVLDGDRIVKSTLFSYGTPIVTREKGNLIRHYEGWTATTGTHIGSFCSMNKKGFQALPYVPYQ